MEEIMQEQAKVQEKTVREKLTEVLAGFKKDRSRLIPILQRVQDAFAYLPRDAMLEVGSYLGMTDVQIYGVASFYNYFRFTPLGKYPIQMCMGTACHMMGGGLVLEALERALDIKVGGITEDGDFSLDRVACIGCCGLAPVMTIGERIYPKMTPATVDEALVKLKMEAKETNPENDDQTAKED
jgi:NADH-quinone oxidoreductase subunit E